MVLTSTRNLYFEQKYEKYQSFLTETFQFLEVKFSVYLNRRVFLLVNAQTDLKLGLAHMSEVIFSDDAAHKVEQNSICQGRFTCLFSDIVKREVFTSSNTC